MSTLLRKEVRLILPVWLTSMLLAIGPVSFIPTSGFDGAYAVDVIAGLCFAVGAILLSLAPFGQEFNHGTFSLLLAQPFPRRRLWWIKAGVSAVALASTLLVLCISYATRFGDTLFRQAFWPFLLGLAFFAGGFWTTLLFRQITSAFWFTLLIPLAILVGTTHLLDNRSQVVQELAVGAVLVVYAVAGFLWARRQFLYAQDTGWTGGTISLPTVRSYGSIVPVAARVHTQRPVRALIWKEFQLHGITFLLAGILFLLHLAVITIRKSGAEFASPHRMSGLVLEFFWLVWFVLPLLIGSASVADERKAGTLESTLSLPTSRRVQFALKLGVALFLGTVMGGLMPWAEVAIFGLTPTEGSIRRGLGFVAAAFAGATVISLYASTLTRNMLQAISLALMVGFTLMTLGTLAMDSGYYLRSHSGLPLMEYIGVLTIPTVLLWLAFKNHKQLQVTWKIWLRNLLAVAGSLAFVPLATALIYQRTWELPLTLEPRHAAAQLSGSVRPKILLAGPRMFVLLPDGRLWTTEEYEWEYRYKYYPNSFPLDPVVEDFDVPIPHAGTFSGPANWVNVVSTHSKVAGIQADGSLWKILSGEGTNQTASPRLERIGTDSSWKAIAAGTHFLALKEDGTIWGWGSNESRQLGPGPEEVKGDPVQIGRDSDWAAVFAINSTSIGLKRDGSVWKWGYLGVGPNRAQCQGWESGFYPEPVRWDWEGSDWVSFSGTWSAELILRRDGSLWARGWPSNDNLDLKPVRVGTDFDWGAVALGPNDGLVAVKRGGVIFQEDIDGPSPRDFWRPSRYSDWIAIAPYGSEAFVALAADGTLCSWGHPIVPVAGVASLLAPTRRPLWSVNVLDRTR